MYTSFDRVNNIDEAVEQLNKLRKVVTEKPKANGNTVYEVDGKDYSRRALIAMANSVVNDAPLPDNIS